MHPLSSASRTAPAIREEATRRLAAHGLQAKARSGCVPGTATPLQALQALTLQPLSLGSLQRRLALHATSLGPAGCWTGRQAGRCLPEQHGWQEGFQLANAAVHMPAHTSKGHQMPLPASCPNTLAPTQFQAHSLSAAPTLHSSAAAALSSNNSPCPRRAVCQGYLERLLLERPLCCLLHGSLQALHQPQQPSGLLQC